MTVSIRIMKTKLGFVGGIFVRVAPTYSYVVKAPVVRAIREDAVLDAETLKKDLLSAHEKK